MKSFVLAILNVVLPLFGVIVGGVVSNHSAVKQMKFESKRLRHQEKREAYSAFLSEYHKFLLTAEKGKRANPNDITGEEMEESIHFSSAYAVAALHAPTVIREKLKELYTLATFRAQGKETPNLAEKYEELQDLLYHDLRIM